MAPIDLAARLGDRYISKRELLGAAQALATELRDVQRSLAGAVLVNYVMAIRAGGELRLTHQEILDATGGTVRVSHAANGEWVLTAMADATQPYVQAMTEAEMVAYEAKVQAEERAQATGGGKGNGSPPPTAALEGDDVLGAPSS